LRLLDDLVIGAKDGKRRWKNVGPNKENLCKIAERGNPGGTKKGGRGSGVDFQEYSKIKHGKARLEGRRFFLPKGTVTGGQGPRQKTGGEKR